MQERIYQILDELRAIGAYPVGVETDDSESDIGFTGADTTEALKRLVTERNDLYKVKLWVLNPAVSKYLPSQIITVLSTGSTIIVPVQTIPDRLFSETYHKI